MAVLNSPIESTTTMAMRWSPSRNNRTCDRIGFAVSVEVGQWFEPLPPAMYGASNRPLWLASQYASPGTYRPDCASSWYGSVNWNGRGPVQSCWTASAVGPQNGTNAASDAVVRG